MGRDGLGTQCYLDRHANHLNKCVSAKEWYRECVENHYYHNVYNSDIDARLITYANANIPHYKLVPITQNYGVNFSPGNIIVNDRDDRLYFEELNSPVSIKLNPTIQKTPLWSNYNDENISVYFRYVGSGYDESAGSKLLYRNDNNTISMNFSTFDEFLSHINYMERGVTSELKGETPFIIHVKVSPDMS